MAISVVVDEGSAQTKLTFRNPQGEIITQKIPSRVVRGLKMDFSAGGYSGSSYIVYEGDVERELTVSSKSEDTVVTNGESFQISAANRCLVHEILRKNGFGGREVDISVTLPVNQFYRKTGGSPFNDELIQSKKDNLTAKIKSAANQKLARILSVDVFPEAIPAVFDITREDDGDLKPGYEEGMKFLSIDIGGTTTDVSVIMADGSIDNFDSFKVGVINMAAKLAELLSATDICHGKVLPRYAAEEALKNRRFASHDITPYIKKACIGFVDEIVTNIETMIGNVHLLDKVFIVGGGAALIGEDVGNKLNITPVIPENPDSVISRGIFKIQNIMSPTNSHEEHSSGAAMKVVSNG